MLPPYLQLRLWYFKSKYESKCHSPDFRPPPSLQLCRWRPLISHTLDRQYITDGRTDRHTSDETGRQTDKEKDSLRDNKDQFILQLLHRLHWLRAPERISYKLAVLVFQCTHGLGPVYLTDTLQPVAGIPGRQHLRSSSTSALVVPPIRLATVGDRACPVVAARIWNNLPAEVTSSSSLPTFKSKLKSHLFLASFP